MFPELLFEILGKAANLAERYEFKAVELKELSFRTDGVFTPKENYPTDPIYFLEVQFQKKDDFYWRFIVSYQTKAKEQVQLLDLLRAV